MSRPRADILSVRPSSLVNKIYISSNRLFFDDQFLSICNLVFKGQATEQTTVKWSIQKYLDIMWIMPSKSSVMFASMLCFENTQAVFDSNEIGHRSHKLTKSTCYRDHVTYHKLIVVTSFVFTHFCTTSETLKWNQKWKESQKHKTQLKHDKISESITSLRPYLKTQIEISTFCTFHSKWRTIRLAIVAVVLFYTLKIKGKIIPYQENPRNIQDYETGRSR